VSAGAVPPDPGSNTTVQEFSTRQTRISTDFYAIYRVEQNFGHKEAQKLEKISRKGIEFLWG